MSKRTYSTVDKATWGDGPWQSEPDKVQWKDEATGFACLAKRQPTSGHWCGYVGVPNGHPAYEVDYDDVRVGDGDWPKVHGGLTYSAHCQEGPEAVAICHVPEPGEPDDVWWLGFDCAHAHDLQPGIAALLGESSSPPWLEHYRSLPYVRAEVARLAAQLADPQYDRARRLTPQ